MARILSTLAAATFLLIGSAVASLADLRLVMFEEAGCTYCIMWTKEIGPIYPKTAEGRAAPLQRVDLRKAMPDDLRVTSKPRFTPTFVLVRDGIEIDRLEGYPGEDFFWGLLGRMLEDQPEWRSMTEAAEG